MRRELNSAPPRRSIALKIVALSYLALAIYQRKFEKLGLFLSRHQSAVLILSVLVVLLSCGGFLRMGEERSVEYPFVMKDSEAKNHIVQAARHFPLLGARREEIILEAKSGKNVLTKHCLVEAVVIHRIVKSTRGFREICVRLRRSGTGRPSNSCFVQSPLELAGPKASKLDDLTSIMAREMNDPKMILSNGRTFPFSVGEMLGDFKVGRGNETTATARAIRMVYFVKPPKNKFQTDAILRMEKILEDRLTILRAQTKCTSVSFMTVRMSDEGTTEPLQPNFWLLIISGAISMGSGIILTSLLCCSNWLVVSLLAFGCSILALVCSVGMAFLLGLQFSHTFWFLPFLLPGEAVTLALIVVKELEEGGRTPSYRDCLARTGFLLGSTAVVDMAVFGIAAKSSFPGVNDFFLFAFFAVLFLFMLFLIPFMVLLTMYIKRKKVIIQGGLAKFVKKMSKVPIVNSVAIRKVGHSFWVKKTEAWSRTITTLYGRMMALMLTAAIIVFCVLYILRPGGRFNTILSFQRSSNIRDFQSASAQMFDQEVDVQIVFSGKIDYTKKTIQRKLWTMSRFLSHASYSARPISNWVVPLLKWSRTNEVNCTDAKFFPCLTTFIKENPSFRTDIKFSRRNTSVIEASRFHLHMKWANKAAVKINYLKQLREDLNIVPATIVSEKFVHLDEFIVFHQESLLTFGIATGIVAAVIFAFTLSPLVSFLLALTMALQLIEAVVLIQILDVPLNQISFLTFFTGVVVSMNSSIFIAQSFVISSKKTSRECAADAFASYGLTVLLGGVVTILGSISLGFGFPHFSNIFHFLLPLVLILGWIHAYFILPPLLSLVRHDLGNLTPADVIVPSLRSLVERAKRQPTSHSEHRRKPKHPGISIIGISCKFPQATSKDDFWDMLVNGRCAVADEFPANRPEQREHFQKYHHPKRYVRGRLVTVEGAYLESIKGFDAHFFGISPQEARSMDPQQRVLMQVVYEAIEDAGVRLEDLQKCKTGVFVGEMNTDYRALVSAEANLSNIDQFTLGGTAASMLANRVSFCFNFTGPSLSVNTACSSSLTAVKLASDSLHRGDCEVAIVCAPNIVLDYSLQVMQSLAGLLSPAGRCRNFDAQGDGCGRGEGFAAVILKLTDASIGDNDDLYCEILACGMNSCGQSAVSITAPSSKMQAILSHSVLEESGLNANDIDYFEMHGHGSAVNDAVEIGAIEETYCKRIPFEETRALRIGSVKSNLNHTESTSGLAGLIKVALMLKNQTFVRTVVLRELNPALKLEAKGLMVQHESETWNKKDGKPRVGAVNSFGYGGSNVHAIVREILPKPRMPTEARNTQTADVITLSAKSMTSLQDMAKALAHWFLGIDTEAESLRTDLCYSLNERRTQHTHRLALAFGKVDEAHSAVLAFANQQKGWEDFVDYGETKVARTRKVVFVFGGEGSQWYAMGRQLISNEPTFKEAIIHVSNLLQNLGEKWSLLDLLDASEDTSRITETSIAQLAVFSLQYATAELLKSWGIFPCAVLGYSLGEFAAACTAGSISVEEATRLVLLLSKLQEKCPGNGAMAALGLAEEKVQSLLIELRLYQTLDVAAVTDANSVVVSGDSESIECLGNYIAVNYADVPWETLGTGRAFHSFHMETIKKSFESSVGHIGLHPRLSQIPIYSTVTGDVVPGKHLDASYWWKNIRYPVKFDSAVKQLLKDDHEMMIEISVQPSLANHIKQIALQEDYAEKDLPLVMQTFPRRSVPVTEQHRSFLHHTVCKLYTQGFSLNWRRLRGDQVARFIRLPSYPWQEKEYWYRDDNCKDEILPLNLADSSKIPPRKRHPFLEKSKTTEQFSGLNCWDTDIDLHRFPTLRDHTLIQGGAVMPGAAHLEIAFAMALEKFACQAVELKDVRLLSLLTLPETQVRSLRLRLFGQRGDGAKYRISYVQDDKSELLLSDGEILADLLSTTGPQKTLDQSVAGENIKQFVTQMQEMPLMEHRQLTEKYGYNFGRAFSIIKRIWRTTNQGLCLISVENDMLIRQEMSSYVIHPTILDACLQTCLVPAGDSLLSDKPLVPVGARSVSLLEHPRCTQLFCHVTMKANAWGVFDIVLMSPRGKVLVAIKEYRVSGLKTSTLSASFEDVAFEQEWLEILPQPSTVNSEDNSLYVVLKDSAGFGNALIERLHSCGVDVIAFDLPSSGNFDEKAIVAIKTTFDNLPSDFQQIKVISLWPAETYDLPEEFESIDRAQGFAFQSSVFLMQLLNESDIKSTLYLVTRTTQVLCGASAIQRATMPWGASVWGLRRTASLELTNPTVIVVDLSAVNDPREVKLLKDEVRNSSEEAEIAYRQGKRYINRLVRVKEQNLTEYSNRDGKSQTSMCLVLHPNTKSLCVKKQTTCKLSDHDIEVDVLHCWHQSESLFKLMKSKSCIFFTGRVATLPEGPGHRLRVGDEICGVVSSGRFGNRVQLDRNQIFPRMPTMSREQAATLPACLSIAYHAVRKLANERSGQRVLIHEANRGPGLVALLIASALGHKAVCTSSADDIISSRKMLLEMGAEQVLDASCSDLTEESGLFNGTVFFYDPLPNSVHQSCQVLKRGGKLVVVSALESGDMVLRADKFIAYERLDMASDFLTPGTFEKLCSASVQLLEQNGSLASLLHLEHRSIDVLHAINLYNTDGKGSTYGMGTSSPALTALSFATLQVDTVKSRGIAILPSGLDEHGLKPNRTYLVVGEIQGIGFELVRWLVENGAKTVVVVDSVALSDSKKRELTGLGRRSASKVLVVQGDVSSPQEMASLRQKLQSLPSVAGIVLTAHVMRDEPISALEMQNAHQAMTPKVKVAFLLHQMSSEMDLDFFVMFSSMTSLIGTVAQASSSSANAFLDSLAQYRRCALGLPGLAINWGPVGETRGVDRGSDFVRSQALSGFQVIPAKQGIEYTKKVLVEEPNRSQICLADMDWTRVLETNPALAQSTRLERISIAENTKQALNNSAQSLAPKILLEKDAERRRELVLEYVKVVMVPWTEIHVMTETEIATSLCSFGIDSSAAMTLKIQFEANLQVPFEVPYFLQPDTTILKIAKDVNAQLKKQQFGILEADEATSDDKASSTETPGAENGISSEAALPTCKVVPLYTPDGAAVKLFCIHPSHRLASSLATIASGFQFQTTVSFYALGLTAPAQKNEDWGSVRELATKYVTLIREEQRHGPYFLAGYSYGGLVAYEMACVLTEQEEVVEFLGMIDTFPWYPPSKSLAIKLTSMLAKDKLPERQVQVQFEAYLAKMAVETLKMTAEEYQALKLRNNQRRFMETLYQRARAMNVTMHDLEALYLSLLHDHKVASRTHLEWQPAEVRYPGRLTYLKGEDKKSTASPPTMEAHKAWAQVVNGNIDVYVCPGNHYSMAEQPHAQLVGGVLATAINFKYQSLFPELRAQPRSYKGRRAVQRFHSGVALWLHSKKGLKPPRVGEIVLKEDKHQLLFRRRSQVGHEKTACKIIQLGESTIVLPGRYVPSAITVTTQTRNARELFFGNIDLVASVVTTKRAFNLEFRDFADLKYFYSMAEAIFGTPIGVA